ncbi:MAG: AMP-binding protein, partial [Gemmatimonadetes bacterium]|nr:AMP-binding protein [Gemmatimonadota bacterium]
MIHPSTGATLDYTRAAAIAAGAAEWFVKQGIRPGDRVALLTVHHIAFVPVLAGAAHIGASIVPVNPHLHPDELTFILADAEPAMILADEAKELAKRFRETPQFVIGDVAAECETRGAGAASETTPFPRSGETGRKSSRNGSAANGDPDDPVPAITVYTSGTTSSGKGVMLSEANLIAMAQLLAGHYAIDETDRFYGVLPLHHMNGIMMTGILPLVAGGSAVLADLFSFKNAKFYWQHVAEHEVTVPSLVPSIMAMLLRLYPNGAGVDLSRIKHAFCGTAPLPEPLWKSFEERFAMPVYQGYGLTETTTWATATPCTPGHRHDSVGVPLGAEIEIDCAAGGAHTSEEGEVLIKGPMVMIGYLNRKKATREIFRDDFIRTGDLGYFEDGELLITGRRKEIIIKNGLNINPNEVDEVVSRHPDILESKTMGDPDEIVGESITTVCVPRDYAHPPASEDVKHHVSEMMSAHYRPDKIVYLAHLPKGPTGKVAMRQLRGILSGELSEEIVKRLTAWKYRRSQPNDRGAVVRTVQKSLESGDPIRFLTYWGCGKRAELGEVDRLAIDRMLEMLASAEYIETIPAKLTILLNDMHSRVNEVPEAHYKEYYSAVAAYAKERGIASIWQSDVWEALGLDLDKTVAHAESAEFDEAWSAHPLRADLT